MINEKLIKTSEFLTSQEWMKDLFEAHANVYLVGGFVRDFFLDRESKDMDFVIEKLSFESIMDILSPHGKLRIDNVGERFKTLKFRPKGWKGEEIDIATPRKDVKIGSGHKGFETIGVETIEEDLGRRDFTINSIAYDVFNEFIIDPFYGLGDIELKIIKATDKEAFVHDPLRIMRGIQFASRFVFDIEKSTKALMKKNAHLISEITGERILMELEKILNKKGDTRLALKLISETDLDIHLFHKKMIDYDNLVHEHLEPLSFFYLLGTLGGVNPEEFYRTTLRGDKQTGKDLRILKNLLFNWKDSLGEEIKRFRLFKAIEIAPSILDSSIVPNDMDFLFDKMEAKVIPTFMSDIQINGNDIIEKIGEGPKVGIVLAGIQRAALMNEFKWEDREESLKFLNEININN